MSALPAVAIAAFAALAPLLGAPAPASSASAHDAFEGCTLGTERSSCAWAFHEEPEGPGPLGPHQREYRIPVFARTLASVTVFFEGTSYGWYFALWEVLGEGESASVTRLSYSFHAPDSDPLDLDPVNATGIATSEASAHWFETREDAAYWLVFSPSGDESAVREAGERRGSSGDFSITYLAEPLPAGEPSPRPAATRDDPQILDGTGDVGPGDEAYDVEAAWFDDARLGDGVFDAHLAVRDLASLDLNATRTRYATWDLEFTISDRPFAVRWGRGVNDQGEFWYCQLGEREPDGDFAVLSFPQCEWSEESSSFSASIAERVVGSPGAGTLFAGLRATSAREPTGDPRGDEWLRAQRSGGIVQVDASEGARYPFALGGPAVWDELNPRLAIVPPATLPWYRAPLARENVPDTLQVLGVPAAGATFLLGLLVLRRRRGRVHALFAEVDRVAREHEADARAALVALGDLERRMDRRYRAGELHENEYQIVSQRIATAATRFALKRELLR